MNSKDIRGDTIIEVIICTAIIGLALAAGYSMTSKSLRTGVAAGQRTEALYLAQGQIEFIKNAVKTQQVDSLYACPNNQGITSCTSSPLPAFCISSSGAYQQDRYITDTGGSTPTSHPCKGVANTQYTVYNVYDPQKKTFTTTANWTSFSANRQDQLKLYYKVP